VILDRNGNLFGGFTPVEWESRVWNGMDDVWNNCFKADDSQKSFLFTLKNPHNIPAMKFALKADCTDQAIICDSTAGPWFGRDILVSDNCNTNTNSFAVSGFFYSRGPEVGRKIVFTGSRNFQVQEIEVFEITN
jgi:hypothetical protein